MEGVGKSLGSGLYYAKVGEEFKPIRELCETVTMYSDETPVETLTFRPPEVITFEARVSRKAINHILGWRGKGLSRPRRRMLIRAARRMLDRAPRRGVFEAYDM